MKLVLKRTTALCIILLLTASLLASCSGGDERKEGPQKTVATYDDYVGSPADLGLTQDEVVMDILEVDGELRATIGVAVQEIDGKDVTLTHGTPRLTEHRYYDMDFVEDVEKREKTAFGQEASVYYDSAVDLAFGGEPFLTPGTTRDPFYFGVEYYFYRDGQSLGTNMMPDEATNGNGWKLANYGVKANFQLQNDVIYTGINYGNNFWQLYVKDHFVELPSWHPGAPEYQLCGLMAIGETPYALIRVWEEDRSEQVVDVVWQEARLIPLTSDMTELPLEGTRIDGIPTGGAFHDGKYGYFMCDSELWRTDGKESHRIADLIFFGVSLASDVRSVRTLSDGRILVVADGRVIELTGTELAAGEQKQVFTAGVINLYGDVSELTLTFSKFNRVSEKAAFVVKEFDDQADLNLALLSGEISMVISRDQFMLKNYVKQDILAPLEEVAPELFEKDVLIENIVDATRLDGVCYYLPRSFWIEGEITNAKFMEEGQTFETRLEYYDFLAEKVPDYFKPLTKRVLFSSFGQDIDEWIDWKTNTCHFDDGSLEALLEFCGKGSTQAEVEQYAAQSNTVNSINFLLQDSIPNNHFSDVKSAKEYLTTESGKDAWVCYPIPSSTYEGYEILAPEFFAVVKDEASREAAGEFLRWHFLENVTEEFPPKNLNTSLSPLSINRAETDRFLRRNIDGTIEIPDDMEEWKKEMYEVHNRGCGQEQYEITWSYIEKGDHFQYFRNVVFDVMYEEAERYFAGSITAEQVADYVQNRISLYLAEQS